MNKCKNKAFWDMSWMSGKSVPSENNEKTWPQGKAAANSG